MPDALTAIAAVARNGVIGAGGHLPWNIPADMRHFRETTMGGALVMGRTTYDSLAGRPLPGREVFVVSRVQGIGLDDAIRAARATGRRVFIAGGEQIYRIAWPLLTELDLTLVDAEPAGDRYFPAVDEAEWQEMSREPHDGFSFVTYQRRGWAPAGRTRA